MMHVRYQRGNQSLLIEEGQIRQWPKETGQNYKFIYDSQSPTGVCVTLTDFRYHSLALAYWSPRDFCISY